MKTVNILPIRIQKLFLQGKIDRVYDRMYILANNLAAKELKENLQVIGIKYSRNNNMLEKNYVLGFSEEIMKFKNKRIKYHMDEMKELLKLSIERKQ